MRGSDSREIGTRRSAGASASTTRAIDALGEHDHVDLRREFFQRRSEHRVVLRSHRRHQGLKNAPSAEPHRDARSFCPASRRTAVHEIGPSGSAWSSVAMTPMRGPVSPPDQPSAGRRAKPARPQTAPLFDGGPIEEQVREQIRAAGFGGRDVNWRRVARCRGERTARPDSRARSMSSTMLTFHVRQFRLAQLREHRDERRDV